MLIKTSRMIGQLIIFRLTVHAFSTIIVVFTRPANFRKVLTFERNHNSLTCELLSTRRHTVRKELTFERKNRKWRRFAMTSFDLKFLREKQNCELTFERYYLSKGKLSCKRAYPEVGRSAVSGS